MLPTVLTINGEMKKPPYFQQNYYYFFIIILGLGKVKTISGPSAEARTGYGAERCSHGLG